MKRKVIGKIIFIDGKSKYISGKELEEYELEISGALDILGEIKEGLREKVIKEIKK